MGNSYKTTFDKYPKDKLIEITKRAGAASVIARKHKKAMRDIAHILFTENISHRNIIEQIKEAGYEGEFSYEEILAFKLLQRALSKHKNTIDAFKVIRFLSGESNYKTVQIKNRIRW